MAFRIENPEMLLAFIPLLFLLGLQLYHFQMHRAAFGWRRFIFTFLGFSSGILGIARIQAGSYELKKAVGEGDLYLAIDVSKSMLAEDILPTRLQFAAAFSEKLLQTQPKSRVALFPFAADGFVLMPLSSDHLAATDLLKGLSPSLTTDQGTDLSVAMETLFTAIQKRQQSAERSSPAQVILMSDGESHRDLNTSIFARFKDARIPIFTIGVGTTQGSQLLQTLGYGNFRQVMRDSSGRPVQTRLDKDKLEKVALSTDGAYFPARMDQIPLLAKRLNQRLNQGGLQTSFQVQREFFPEFLMLAFILLAIEVFAVRWEYLVRSILWLATAAALQPASLQAWSEETEALLNDAGKNRPTVAYNEALSAMNSGNFADAADLFLESAQSTQDMNLRKKSLYNLGNAQLRQQDPIQAMAAYQQSMDTKASDSAVEKDANQRASDNLVLAARMQQQMSQSQSGQQDKEQSGQQEQQDPGGPKKDFKAQGMSEKEKQKMLDLSSEQEREVRARLQKEKNQKKGITSSGKDW